MVGSGSIFFWKFVSGSGAGHQQNIFLSLQHTLSLSKRNTISTIRTHMLPLSLSPYLVGQPNQADLDKCVEQATNKFDEQKNLLWVNLR